MPPAARDAEASVEQARVRRNLSAILSAQTPDVRGWTEACEQDWAAVALGAQPAPVRSGSSQKDLPWELLHRLHQAIYGPVVG